MKALLRFITSNKFNIVDIFIFANAAIEIDNSNYLLGISIALGGFIISAIITSIVN